MREAWYPLGYNARPGRLWRIANTVVRHHGGRLPTDAAALLRLPGIGPYTARAVLAFAYHHRVPVLETNVRRVLQRVFYARAVSDRILWRLAEQLLPRRPYDFNQALMDFGALVCTARRPQCPACPMRDLCRSYPRLERAARDGDRRRVAAIRPSRARTSLGASRVRPVP